MELHIVKWSGRTSDNVESGHIVQVFTELEDAQNNFLGQIEDILNYWTENFLLLDAEIEKTDEGSFLISRAGNGAWDSVNLTTYYLDEKRATIFEYIGY